MTEFRYEVTLLEAARQGDADAINHLLELAQPDIRRYAYLIFKAAEVDAVEQETHWFTLLARKCRRAMSLLGLRGAAMQEVGKHEYLLLMPAEELRHDLARAIQSLPEHYRTIIVLRDIEEMGIPEIAGVLQQTGEAIKQELLRARLMLCEYLRDF